MHSVSQENQTDLHFPGKAVPVAADALTIYFIVIMLLVSAGQFLISEFDYFTGLLSAEVFLLLVPVYLYSKKRKFDQSEIFRLKFVNPAFYLSALIAGVGGTLLAVSVAVLQNIFIPFDRNSDIIKIMKEIQDERGMLLSFIVLALAPAICEEIMFRGILLKAFEKEGKVRAIVLSSLLFGIFHLDSSRVLPTAILGLVMGWMVWTTGSIWSGVLIHFLNNSIVVVLARVSSIGTEDTGGSWIAAFILIVPAAFLFLYAGSLIIRMTKRLTPGTEQAV